jgi:protein-export membrane protein SecD/preprotein translocase SecF subunit
MDKAAKWRIWSSVALLVIAAVMVWPTLRWYTLPASERDRAEASVQPETDNPRLVAVMDEIRAEGGDALIEEYRSLYALKLGTIKLGLDLQGGMYLAYTVEPTPGLDTDEAIDQALEVVRNRIDEFGVSEPSITRQGDDRIVIQLPGVRDPARARAIVERQAMLEFKIVAYPRADFPTPSGVQVVRDIDDLLAGTVVEAPLPLDSLVGPLPDSSVGEAPEIPADTSTGIATVPEGFEMPGQGTPAEIDPAAVPEPLELERPGTLSSIIEVASEEMARASRGASPGDWIIWDGEDTDAFNDCLSKPGVDSILAAANLTFVFGRLETTDYGTFRPLFLVPINMTRGWDRQSTEEREDYLLTGANLTDVRIQMGNSRTIQQEPYLILEFDADGARNWERITGDNVDQRVAIVLDGTVYSAATIQERISGSGTRLSGGFAVEEARDLRLVLKAGSLPARLVIAEEQTVGPSLGQQAIDRGMISGIVALLLVGGFMVFYYRTAGVIAILALFVDILMLMAVLCFPGPLAHLGITGLNATLTLPGIAGIILTIGMAVDANVLIFERIREEKRSGKSIRTAIKAGYSRAFITIFDSNLTTLITALVLYRFGTGPIKGFAVTLSIGILVSMFCALVLSRAIMWLLLQRRGAEDMNTGKLAMFLNSHIGFVKLRKRTYLLSGSVFLVGVLAFIIHGGLNLSIDFTGGLETNVISEYNVATEDLTAALVSSGLADVQVQELMDYQGEAAAAFVVLTSEVDKEVVYQALEANGCVPMEELQEGDEGLSFIKQIGPRVGAELRDQAINAILISMFFIVLYVWYRFQFRWGVAAIVALTHDVVITVGMIALVRMDLSLTIVAALLTIVGYSINDTIVVFDRIRENRNLRKGKTLAETIDISINETLSRTIITSLTTFMAALVLWLISGGVLSDFALTLMFGFLIGTYSSIFVAAPILVDWHAKVKGKTAAR